LFTGQAELHVFHQYGGWLSLIVFAVVAAMLLRGPFRKGLPE